MTKRPVATKQKGITKTAGATKAKAARKAKPVEPELDELDLALLFVVDSLNMAAALVPKSALRASGLAQELSECQKYGYNHLALWALQEVGCWLESRGKDKALSPEFWRHLADAAKAMELDAFIPYFLGKADGRTLQTWADVEVGLAELARELPTDLRTQYKAAAQALDAYVLSQAKREDGPNPEFMALFDGLFALITDPGLPVELNDAAWPVLACNTFEIGFSAGANPISSAQVWWRDSLPAKAKAMPKAKAKPKAKAATKTKAAGKRPSR